MPSYTCPDCNAKVKSAAEAKPGQVFTCTECEAKFTPRQSPAKLDKAEIAQLHAAMRNVNLSEGQTMQMLRYANRVPLQFQPAACAITQAIVATNWRSYGLSQSRGSLPSGPIM